MTNSERLLEHSGVKGMKWGKRKSQVITAKPEKEKSRLRKQIDSNKREVSTLKALRKSSGMSDAELRSKTDRLRSENNLKRLTKADKPALTRKGKAKQDIYYDRAKLSDSELKAKVSRLQLEDNLNKEIKSATKQQRDAANKIITEVAKIALTTYATKGGGFSATGNSNMDAILGASLKYAKEKPVIK